MDRVPGDWGQRDLTPSGKDPYRPAWAWRIGLGVITLSLLTAVVVIQRPAAPQPGRAAKAASGLTEEFRPSIESTLIAKVYFGMRSLMTSDPTFPNMMQESLDSAAGFETAGPNPLGIEPPARKEGDLPPPAISRLHAGVMAGETLGPEEALSRFDQTEPQIAAESPLLGDLAIMRRVYGGEPAAEVAASLGDQEREEFLDRHGLFGGLVLSYGEEQAQARIDAASSGQIMVLSMFAFGGAAMLAGFIGAGLLITLCVLLFQGKLHARFRVHRADAADDQGPTSWGWGMDPQGRLIWLETVAVFMAGFLLLGVSGDVLGAKYPNAAWVAFYSLIGQWVLVLTLFWPVVRGMPWQRWRGELGWHRGEGFWKEVGSGLVGYLASLPIYFVAAIVVAIYILIRSAISGQDAAPPAEDNKLLDLAMSGNPVIIAMIFLLATLWAPVVEESVFRGALYRHWRGMFAYIFGWIGNAAAGSIDTGASRLFSILFASLFTAIVFAVMHGYAVIQLLMVGVLGFVFALMREWRGSLIAPMTAHFTHNTIVLTFVIILFGQLAK